MSKNVSGVGGRHRQRYQFGCLGVDQGAGIGLDNGHGAHSIPSAIAVGMNSRIRAAEREHLLWHVSHKKETGKKDHLRGYFRIGLWLVMIMDRTFLFFFYVCIYLLFVCAILFLLFQYPILVLLQSSKLNKGWGVRTNIMSGRRMRIADQRQTAECNCVRRC